MAPPIENTPASTQSDGRWRITQVPTGSNALSAAILAGATAKPLTYGFTADGFNHSASQATVEDKRLTLIQNLSRPGKVTETLEVKYVASTDANSADAILTENSEGQLNIRKGIGNDVAPAAGQKADVVTYVAGVKRPDAPTENGIDTISQTLFITKPTVRGAILVA
jgi:hypothetical protein